MTTINICLIQPRGYIHSHAFDEVARYFACMAKALGHEPEIVTNRFRVPGLNIILCGHMLDYPTTPPPGSVIFNGEPLASPHWTNTQRYDGLLRRYRVWDYSAGNLERIPHERKSLVTFGYRPEMATLKLAAHRDIDLLFYGSVNARRRAILDAIAAAGVQPTVVFGVYGAERDALIARSRAVLNLHQYDGQVLEQIRCFWPLTNRVPVISEEWERHTAPAIYDSVLLAADGPENIATIVRYGSWLAAYDWAARFGHYDPLPEFATALKAALAEA